MAVADDNRVNAALTKAIQQLESAIREQETAANRILGLCEILYDTVQDSVSRLKIEAIMEACAFHDLTAQRIHKVSRLIRYLRDGQLVSDDDLPPPAPAPEEQEGLSQEQVDKLLTGGKPVGQQK